MTIRSILLVAASAAALAACSSSAPVALRYNIAYKDLPAGAEEMMPRAITNVVGGRLGSLGVTPTDLKVEPSGSGAVATVTVPAGAADEVTKQLSDPYTLRFLRQTGTGETVTVNVAKYGDFSESGLNETHVTWVEAALDAEGQGQVTISFNDAGHQLLASLAETDAGRQYGLFAKGRLISLFTMQADFGGDIVLNKIPSAELAAIFADDVDVGLHAVFTRAQ
jgi:hypothetical protein